MSYGNISIWNLNSKNVLNFKNNALEDYINWFPDNRRIVFVSFLDRKEISKLPNKKILLNSSFAVKLSNWTALPVITILNIETGEAEYIHVGRFPVISQNGDSIIFSNFYSENWKLYSLNKNKVTDFNAPPGMVGFGPLAFNDKYILYWGLPTKGSKIKYTKNNSLLRGPKPMLTIKVAEIDTDKFETIIPYIDPRSKISYGK